MRLPAPLIESIENLSSGQIAKIQRAAHQLSDAYQSGDFRVPALRSREHRLAYLLTRFPATFAACTRALRECALRVPGFSPRTMLDLGSGPGTACWATTYAFPTTSEFTLVERDSEMTSLGREIMNQAGSEGLKSAHWRLENLTTFRPEEQFDLVAISYSLGELSAKAQTEIVANAWRWTNGVLLILEPGTKRGFANIHTSRTALLAIGAQIIAPCPHEAACPMQASGDWCHFSERIERTSLHRMLKGGDLGYEDEKFSYVAAARIPAERAEMRIVRHPILLSGHTKLTLCTGEGMKHLTVTKSRKDLYRASKKVDWGSAWPPAPEA